MGRPPKVKAPPVAAARPPLMKYAEAVKLADKNARTIMKISQLMEVIHMPGHAQADPKDRIGAQIANLRSRLNRRLVKLAKWADSSSEDRHGEFRNNPQHNYPYRSLIKPMIYSKPIPVAAINAVKAIAAPVAPVAPSAVKSEIFVPPVVQATTVSEAV
eukprot:gene18415-20962_t